MNRSTVLVKLVKQFGTRTRVTRQELLDFEKSINAKASFVFTESRTNVRGEYDLKLVNGYSSKPEAAAPVETIEQRQARIQERFDTMRMMVRASADKIARSVVIVGPTGLGKSFEANEELALCAGQDRVEFVKGNITAKGLYNLLWENRRPGNVVVFDDCDAVFNNEDSLNLLKSACDTTEKREISWRSESPFEKDGDAPKKFVFEGSVIFITNVDFRARAERGDRMSPHFEAMMSRSHYLDLAISDRLDYVARIRTVIRDKGMLRAKGFTATQENDLLSFLEANADKFYDISIRAVNKLADLMKMSSDWQKFARVTLMKN